MRAVHTVCNVATVASSSANPITKIYNLRVQELTRTLLNDMHGNIESDSPQGEGLNVGRLMV